MNNKSALIIVIAAALALSGCTRTDQYTPGYCGDGMCSLEEEASCTADCHISSANSTSDSADQSEQDWIRQKMEERRNNQNQTQNDNPNYNAVTPGTPLTQNKTSMIIKPIESMLPETDFIVASKYNLLSIGENISGVIGTLTGAQLPAILAGGTLRSNTEAFGPRIAYYQQRFNLRSGRVLFGYDEDRDLVSTYLEYKEGEPIWEYILVLNSGIIKFFQGQQIHFLGHDYILDQVTNQTMLLTGIDSPDTILLRDGHSAVVNSVEIPTDVLNVTFSYEYIKVIVQAPHNMRMLPGERVTDYISRRELLTNALDLEFSGISQTPSIGFTLKKMSTDYKLNIQNNIGYNYSLPIARMNPFMVGNDQYLFHYKEPNSNLDYIIGKKDHFIVTNNKETGGITTLLRLVSVDYADQLVQFEDPALESFYVHFEGDVGKNAFADMPIYGVNHRVYVGNNSRISVDMNGDGIVNGATVPIITIGNSLIKASQDSTSLTLRFITPGKLRENNRQDLETKIIINNDGVSIPQSSLQMHYDTLNVNEQLVGMTDYGTIFVIKQNIDDHTQTGDNLIINQPLAQRFAEVVLKAYE
jgi:hypothetical protein